jgi:hypothetical protein
MMSVSCISPLSNLVSETFQEKNSNRNYLALVLVLQGGKLRWGSGEFLISRFITNFFRKLS